ncbi:hypothetical protein EDD11_008349 [Mortierella claussenii]|nr:hypothetical protein EDD11_008349 [Mortierella claussenii]
MILLKNNQSVLRLPARVVKSQIQMLLTAAGYRDWDIGVCLTGDRKVRHLNTEYRGKDSSTDILSFPFVEAVKPGKMPAPQSMDDKNLGDIFISIPYVHRWCEKNNVDIHERLPVLYAHGICHLLGYDHQEDRDYVQMKKMETRILNRMKTWQAIIDQQPHSSSTSASSTSTSA